MKTKVLEFLQDLPATPEEQFNQALGLYQNSPGNSHSQFRYLNAAGYTKGNLENLMYELKKCNNVTDAEVRAAAMQAQPYPLVNPFAQVPVFGKAAAGNKERQAFCKKNGIEVKGKTNKVLDPAIKKWTNEMAAKWEVEQEEKAQAKIDADEKARLEAEKTQKENIGNLDVTDAIEITATSKEEVFTSAPEEVKDYVSLHDEFPFLDEDNCPEELKILVADKRKHYRKWVEAHNQLLIIATEAGTEASMTEEQIFDLAVLAVDNWEANQAIYAELDHYKKEKKILGEHPIFTERKLKESVDKMTMANAAKRKSNLENYVRRDQKSLDLENDKVSSEGGPNEELISKLIKKIEGWKIELSLVNTKLGVSEE